MYRPIVTVHHFSEVEKIEKAARPARTGADIGGRSGVFCQQ
jgi:hypothetical protein